MSVLTMWLSPPHLLLTFVNWVSYVWIVLTFSYPKCTCRTRLTNTFKMVSFRIPREYFHYQLRLLTRIVSLWLHCLQFWTSDCFLWMYALFAINSTIHTNLFPLDHHRFKLSRRYFIYDKAMFIVWFNFRISIACK